MSENILNYLLTVGSGFISVSEVFDRVLVDNNCDFKLIY